MSHFEDMTPYTYDSRLAPGESGFNIGWLEKGHEFPKIDQDDFLHIVGTGAIASMIYDLLKNPAFNQPGGRHAGSHWCDLCDEGGHNIDHSNVVMKIPAYHPNQFFLFPGMLPHYMTVHYYRPPNQFLYSVNALLIAMAKQGAKGSANGLFMA